MASTSPALDFATYFEDVTDPRIDRRKRHKLLSIVGLTICAVVAGAETFVAIERFGHARKKRLERFLDLDGGIPSRDTLGRVWSRIDPEEFEAGFRQWIAALADAVGELVAADAKTLRRSHDRASSKEPLRMISAWAQQNELVFGQQAVPEAANETGTLPKLLQVLELEGAIVTVDAAGCFPDVTKTIIDQGADYVLTLKGNQGELYRDATRLFDRIRASARPSAAGHKTVDAGHDRVEVCRCWAMEVEGRGLIGTQRWTRLRTLCKVSAERHHPDGTVESEERLFISSLKADPKQLLRAVSAHWHVENKLHWPWTWPLPKTRAASARGSGGAEFGDRAAVGAEPLEAGDQPVRGHPDQTDGGGLESGLPAQGAHRWALNAIALGINTEMRRVTEAIHGQLDWKYLLVLELADPGSTSAF